MAYFRFWNNSSAMPVHIAIHWGGILQHWGNNIPVGGYWETDVPGGGWHAIEVRPVNGENDFNPAKDNLFGVANVVISSVGIVVAAAGIALIPVTGGSSSFITAAGVTVAVGGGVVTAADVAFAIADAVINPATLSNMYGPDGYDIDIRGGDLIGNYDDNTKTFSVTSTRPLAIKWKNNNTGNVGFEPADVKAKWDEVEIWHKDPSEVKLKSISLGADGTFYGVGENNCVYVKSAVDSEWTLRGQINSFIFESDVNRIYEYKDDAVLEHYSIDPQKREIAIFFKIG